MGDLGLAQTIIVRGFADGQKVFKRYVLRRELGRGAMGVVWLAWDEKLDRDVALKFLPEMVRADPGAIDELKRETRRSLQLTHPNIVRVYDFLEDDSSAAIAMEYIDGSTLAALRVQREGRCFEVQEIETWIRDLCAALYFAHSDAKVVHRDLKPANLMVDGSGRLKVTDFGIARSISDSVSRVSVCISGSTSGSLAYMSPQQAIGGPPLASDDVYSIGVTIYELLTGKTPFYSGNVVLQLREISPPRMAERRAELGLTGNKIPKAWEDTVAACLAKTSELRPSSAAEIWRRLESDQPRRTGDLPGKPFIFPYRRALALGVLIAVLAGWSAWRLHNTVPVGKADTQSESASAHAEEIGKKQEEEQKRAESAAQAAKVQSEETARRQERERRQQAEAAKAQSEETARRREQERKQNAEAEAKAAKAQAEEIESKQDEARRQEQLEKERQLQDAQRFSAAKAELLASQERLLQIAIAGASWEAADELSAKLLEGGLPADRLGSYLRAIAKGRMEEELQRKSQEAPLPDLPASGFFDLDAVFATGPYAAYNRRSKEDIFKAAQSRLKAQSLYQAEADGLPGVETAKALIALQRKKGIPVSGRLDLPTLEVLGLQGRQETRSSELAAVPERKPKPRPKASQSSSPRVAKASPPSSRSSPSPRSEKQAPPSRSFASPGQEKQTPPTSQPLPPSPVDVLLGQ